MTGVNRLNIYNGRCKHIFHVKSKVSMLNTNRYNMSM